MVEVPLDQHAPLSLAVDVLHNDIINGEVVVLQEDPNLSIPCIRFYLSIPR
jgi:hypothetical protein